MQKLILCLLIISCTTNAISPESSTSSDLERPQDLEANVIDHGDFLKKRKKRKRKKILSAENRGLSLDSQILKEAEQQLKEWLHFLQESEALASEAEAEDRGLNNSERRRQAKLRYELH